MDYSQKIVTVLDNVLTTYVKNIPPQQKNLILSNTNVENYWKSAFTHSSLDPENNYESYEFVGDRAVNYSFVMYLERRFGKELNQQNGTLLVNKYMGKQYQAKLARDMGLSDLIRLDNRGIVDESTNEDVFESFSGALTLLIEKEIGPGFGYAYLFNIIKSIFDKVDINIEVSAPPVTELKEIDEKLNGSEKKSPPKYTTIQIREGVYKSVVKNKLGIKLGTGEGSSKALADKAAAIDALEKYASEGITLTSINEERQRLRELDNPRLADAKLQLEKAIDVFNQKVQSGKSLPISKVYNSPVAHTISLPGKTKKVYNAELKLNYISRNGQFIPKSVAYGQGDTVVDSQINSMLNFVNKVLS